LFREYVEQLITYDKMFLILGNLNASTYRETFKLLQNKNMWLGASIHSGDREFRVPDNYPLNAATTRIDSDGNKHIRVKGVRWYTNLDYEARHVDLVLYKKYSAGEYPRYDNYDAIEVSKVAEIPMDWGGIMGVPVTFMDKYNPEQFEIVGLTSGRDEYDAFPTKRYLNAKQINQDGSITNGSKVNTGAEIISWIKPNGTYYIADNVPDGSYLVRVFSRILIRNKKVEA